MIFGFEFLKPEFKLQILVLLQYISHLYYVHDISVDQVFGLVLIFVDHPPTTWGLNRSVARLLGQRLSKEIKTGCGSQHK